MGQRSNPNCLRTYVNRGTDSRWFAPDMKTYGKWTMEDKQIKELIRGRFSHAGISRVIINRASHISITIHVAYAGVIIGKKGSVIDALRDELAAMLNHEVRINIKEVKKPDADAQIVADLIAKKMEQPGNFKRHVKSALRNAMQQHALGIRIIVKGRLNGAAIARFEEFSEGSVPMQTLRANVQYGTSTARTSSGACGVKVWIHHGTVLNYNPFEGTDEKF